MTTQSAPALRRWHSLFNIVPGEERMVVSLVALYFALILAAAAVQAVAYGLFIAQFGSPWLPIVYLCIAVVASLVTAFFLKFAERAPFTKVLRVIQIFVIGGLAVLWLVLQTPAAAVAVFLLPVWYQLQFSLANLTVWPVAGRLINVRQGKRLFGLVGAGNWLANIVAGLMVGPLVAAIGSAQILPLAIVSVVAAMVILRAITRRYKAQVGTDQPTDAHHATEQAKPKPLPALLRDRYILNILVYIALFWIASFIVDNIFYDRAEHQFHDVDELTRFFGLFLAAMGVFALITTTLITSRFLARYGMRIGLLTMPVLVIAFTAALALGGVIGASATFLFVCATLSQLCSLGLGFSLSQSSEGVMYQAVPRDDRARVQTLADGLAQPIGIGFAGVLLLVFNTWLGYTAVGLSFVLLAFSVIWFVVIALVGKRYPMALTRVLQRRQFDDATPAVVDRSSLNVLTEALRSPNPGVVIYSLNTLAQLDPDALTAALPALLSHSSAEVRQESLRRIEAAKLTSAADAVRAQLRVEREPEVKAAGLIALSALGQPGDAGQLEAAALDAAPVVRRGALVGLLRYGDANSAAQAAQQLNVLTQSSASADRELAALAAGESGAAVATPLVLTLMRDRDADVRRAATRAAGQLQDASLWGALTEACADPSSAAEARNALVGGGERAMPDIEAAFERAKRAGQREQLIALARACGAIGGERAKRLLSQHITFGDSEVRAAILSSLVSCGFHTAGDREAATAVRAQLQTELTHAAWVNSGRVSVNDETATRPLLNALAIEHDRTRERMFSLLAVQFDAQAVLRARDAWTFGDANQHAYALEVIEAQLPADLKPVVTPALDEISPAERQARWKSALPQPTPTFDERLSDIIAGEPSKWLSSWTRASAVYAVGCGVGDAGSVEIARNSNEPVVREMGDWAAQHRGLAGQSGPTEGGHTMLSTVERVIALKSASAFSRLPDDVLAKIAPLLEEITVSADEVVFKKGDLGDSLYVTVSGSLRAHDDQRLVDTLRPGDVFGEMAVLDPEPRAASITSNESTLLLRLAQQPFYEVMAERPEIAVGIIRMLTARLRARVRDLSEMDVRVKELERTPAQAT